MPEVTHGMYLFLLQEQVRYFKEDDPLQALILLIAIGVIVVVSTVVYFIRRAGRKTVVGNSEGYSAPRQFNPFTFRRISSAYGLNGEQRKLLNHVFRSDNVTDPERVMRNPDLLDRHFKRAFRNIDRASTSEETTQQNLSRLFALRNTIEAVPIEEDPSSGQPVENSQAVLKVGDEKFTVNIIVSQGKNIVTGIPTNTLGTPHKIVNGGKVTLSFLNKTNNSFIMEGTAIGTVKTIRGQGLQITSTGRVKSLTKRRSRRKDIDIRCDFFFVQLFETGKGRKKVSKLVVSPKKFGGNFRNISAGGCAIKTSAPVQAGSRVKISFALDSDDKISVLGQIIRSNRSATGTVMHIKFLKVPSRALNSINTLVYGYDEA